MKTKRLTMTVDEAARALGVGRNSAYEAARAGQIPAIRIGRRLLVPTAAFKCFLIEAGVTKRKSGKRRKP